MAALAVVNQAHRDATSTPIQQVADELQHLLSRRMTAIIANVKDGKTVTRWASGETTSIRLESEQRLRTAYEIMRLLLQYDSPQTVRAWFVGLNPQLGDESPIEVINEGRLKEALAAARAFTAGG